MLFLLRYAAKTASMTDATKVHLKSMSIRIVSIFSKAFLFIECLEKIVIKKGKARAKITKGPPAYKAKTPSISEANNVPFKSLAIAKILSVSLFSQIFVTK